MSIKIRLNNLTTYYGTIKVLDDLSFAIKKNTITTIIGPSGCGKTTLLLVLSGLAALQKDNFAMLGEIKYNKEVFTHKDLKSLIGRSGLVFQQPSAFPFSIEKNMSFATKYQGKKKEECKRIAVEKLREVNLWDDVKNNLKMKATKLSSGQQQRLCIARALTLYPDVLLLDEPCSALDLKNTKIIEQLLLKLKNNYTVVLVTHDLLQAKRISDEIIFMDAGKLVEGGSSRDIFSKPQKKETKDYLNGCLG